MSTQNTFSSAGSLSMAAKGVVPGSPQAKAMQMERYMRTIRDIPALPEMVNKISEKLGLSSTAASEIARMIAYDPGLTSRVLRMVNSAAFGVARQISSIQHAIMILGFNATRGVVLSSSIFKLFEGEGSVNKKSLRDFWEHSLVCALATRVITEFYELPMGPETQPEDAFSAAMLHDIGSLVLDAVAAKMGLDTTSMLENPEDTLMANSLSGEVSLAQEEEIYGLSHTDIGQLLAQKWKLPINLTEVVLYHHQPEKAKLCEDMVFWVAFANELAESYAIRKKRIAAPKKPGESLLPQESLLSHFGTSLLEHYPLDEERLEAMMDRLAEEEQAAGDWLKLFEAG